MTRRKLKLTDAERKLAEAQRRVAVCAPPRSLWLAEMQSEHFRWVAICDSRDAALAALRERWEENARNRSGAVPWDGDESTGGQPVPDYYGAWTRRLEVGRGYMEDEDADDRRPR